MFGLRPVADMLQIFRISTAVLYEKRKLVHYYVNVRWKDRLPASGIGWHGLYPRYGILKVSVLHVSLEHQAGFVFASLVQPTEEVHITEGVLESLDHHRKILLNDEVGGVEHIGQSLCIASGGV